MTNTWLYRIAALLMVIFAVLHTIGFMSFQPPSPEGRAVLDAMNTVHFDLGGKSFTYGQFYQAFGLFITAYMLFAALISWSLSRVPTPSIAWALFAVQATGLALAVIYFAAPQISFSGVITALTGWAAFRLTPAQSPHAGRSAELHTR